MLFCFHRATSPFVPKPWARRIPVPSTGHMADDPKAGRQGLLLQKHTAVSTLNRTFITKSQKQPELVAGPNRAATMPTETRLLPATLLGTRKRDVGGVQKSPSICSAICRPRVPGSCCRGKQRAPICGAGQSWIPGRDHSHIPAPGRLVPCRRPRIPQDTPSALCDAHRDADSRHCCGIDGSQRSEPGVPSALPPLPIRSSAASIHPWTRPPSKTAFSQAFPIKYCYFLLCAHAPVGCSRTPRLPLPSGCSHQPDELQDAKQLYGKV